MNSVATDIANLLQDLGIGNLGLGSIVPAAGVGIFIGEEPPEPSEAITLYGYGGTAEDGLGCENLDNFRLQVRCRARTYEASWKLIQKVEDSINRLKTHEVIDGPDTIFYIDIYRLQPPFEMGYDEKHRFVWTQNYAGLRQKVTP